jgi:hypothetical protein
VYPTHEVVKSLHPAHGKPHGPHNRSSKWSSPSLPGYVIDRSSSTPSELLLLLCLQPLYCMCCVN